MRDRVWARGRARGRARVRARVRVRFRVGVRPAAFTVVARVVSCSNPITLIPTLSLTLTPTHSGGTGGLVL